MVKYCIGVDVLNFPVYVYHNVESITLNHDDHANSKLKQNKANLKVKHYHMQHK